MAKHSSQTYEIQMKTGKYGSQLSVNSTLNW